MYSNDICAQLKEYPEHHITFETEGNYLTTPETVSHT
jgi:hypothetical protein